MFRGKNYKEAQKTFDRGTAYDPAQAFEIVTKASKAKFDETVELHVKLGVDSRHADQQVRGAVVLPHGTGKVRRVLVFCKDERVEEAKNAGADYAGSMDLVEKIQKENWFEFDVVIATPDMMGVVGRLGKILGPKGLMPSPKAGTVTPNLTQAITEVDGHLVSTNGIVATMVDKWAIMHTMVQNRVGYQRDDIKNISMYDYQFTDRYMNNLMLPGIIFKVDDYTPSNRTVSKKK